MTGIRTTASNSGKEIVIRQKAAEHSVHPTGGSLRVFKHFAWLEIGSVKMALSRPTHPRVTHTVGQSNKHSLIEKETIWKPKSLLQ